VVATLTDATYPLSKDVLRATSGLSGAEFVVFDADRKLRESTLPLAAGEETMLVDLPLDKAGGDARPLSASQAVRLGGRPYLCARMLVTRRGTAPRPDSLVVLYPEEQWWAGAREAAWPALLTGAVAALAAVVVTTMLARRFVRPIHELGRQTAAIAQGQFSPLPVPRRDDEIRDLALSINRMTETLGHYEQSVRRNERLRTLGQLGAGMAHQLRNAATGAWMAVELHQRQCPAGAENESLEVALRQLRLMESYLQRFLALGRPAADQRRPVELEPLVRDVLGLVGPACAHAKIELGFQSDPPPLAVRGDAEALRQTLVNLLLNAVEAAGRHGGPPGKVAVELRRGAGDRAAVTVKDSGPGPAPDICDRLFEPFVTEKPEGTGLGLFVARQIAEAHQGTVAWRRDGNLTCFTLELPLLCEDAHGTPAGG
jgi:signal transduction histidine kinase